MTERHWMIAIVATLAVGLGVNHITKPDNDKPAVDDCQDDDPTPFTDVTCR